MSAGDAASGGGDERANCCKRTLHEIDGMRAIKKGGHPRHVIAHGTRRITPVIEPSFGGLATALSGSTR